MGDANPDERPTQRREYSGPGSTLGLAALIVLVVAGLFWYFELRGDSVDGSSEEGLGVIELPAELQTEEQPAARVGGIAPDFRLKTVDGDRLRLSDYRGEYVLVNFWASWCGPCRGETPDLQAFFEEHEADGFMILGLNQQESANTATEFTSDFGVTYPVLLDEMGDVSNAYRVSTGLPVSMLIDPDGVILDIVVGRVLDETLAEYAETYSS